MQLVRAGDASTVSTQSGAGRVAIEEERNGSWKDQVELIGSFAKYGTLIVGGLCLLMYSDEIGQFPEGMGLGEGLAFYLVCSGFLIAYSIYTAVCTATGCLMLGWLARVLQRRARSDTNAHKRRSGEQYLQTDFSSMFELPVVGLGALGLAGHLAFIFFSSSPIKAAMSLTVPLMQGVGVVLLLIMLRRQQHLQSGVVVPNFSDGAIDQRRRNVLLARRSFLVWLVIAPLLLSPIRLFLVDTGFRLAQLRKESATVHIKAPWSTRVGRSTLPSGPSFLGGDYTEFRKVNVLLRSVGQKAVIELPTASGVTRLSLPSEAIYIE